MAAATVVKAVAAPVVMVEVAGDIARKMPSVSLPEAQYHMSWVQVPYMEQALRVNQPLIRARIRLVQAVMGMVLLRRVLAVLLVQAATLAQPEQQVQWVQGLLAVLVEHHLTVVRAVLVVSMELQARPE